MSMSVKKKVKSATENWQEVEMVSVPLNRVWVSARNPRKVMNDAGIAELAESIAVHGLLQPPLARVVENGWEVIMGQRRLLGVQRLYEQGRWPKEILLMVRELTDREATEMAWVENLQREEVSLRDEAEGFAALLDLRDDAGKPVYSVRSLGERLGKSATYVQRRAKLRDLPERAWTHYEAGDLFVKHLELISQIPHAVGRDLALDFALNGAGEDDEAVSLDVAEFRAVLRTRFQRPLNDAQFELLDAELLPVEYDDEGNRSAGGSCGDCPFRAGNMEVPLADGTAGSRGVDPMTCMRPMCYDRKEAKWLERALDDARERGCRVVDVENEVFARTEGRMISFRVDLDDVFSYPGYSALGHYAGETVGTWMELCRFEAPEEFPPEMMTVGVDGAGELRWLANWRDLARLAMERNDWTLAESPFAMGYLANEAERETVENNEGNDEIEDAGTDEEEDWESRTGDEYGDEAPVSSSFSESDEQSILLRRLYEAMREKGVSAGDVLDVVRILIMSNLRVELYMHECLDLELGAVGVIIDEMANRQDENMNVFLILAVMAGFAARYGVDDEMVREFSGRFID